LIKASRTFFDLEKRGRHGGRPKVLTSEKLDAARRLLDAGSPVRDIAAAIGVSIPTVYRHLSMARTGP